MCRIRRRYAPGQRGFTLVELITTLVLVGTVAAIGAPRFADTSPFTGRAFFDDALAATRYTRQSAVASGCTTRIAFNGGYAAFIDCGGGETALVRPGDGTAVAATAPAGTSITATGFTYDRIGRATIGAGGAIVAVGGNSFTVTAETGLAR